MRGRGKKESLIPSFKLGLCGPWKQGRLTICLVQNKETR